MKNLLTLGFIVIICAGCASGPPTLTSVGPKTIEATVSPEASPKAEEPVQKVERPKATGTEDDARRHFIRGMAALEIAKTKDDLLLAIDEFSMATEISPEMAVAWYNLGKAQDQYGLYKEAIESYQKYLDNAPEAQDAQAVKDEMVKLEFRQERLEKSQSREGYWMDNDGSRYFLSVNGNNLTLKALEYVTKDQIHAEYVDSYLLDNSVPIEYQLVLHGNQLSGKWSRGTANVEQSGVCQVPPDAAAVTGEMVESEGKMILNHERSKFLVKSSSFLGANASCHFVKMEGRTTAKISIYGPQKRGTPGVDISGFSKWGEGLFGSIGWKGRLKVNNVAPGSAAYEAGLRDEDEIVAIDGVAVKELSAGQALVRLSGDVGTTVTLEVWRKGSKNTSVIKLKRVETPKP